MGVDTKANEGYSATPYQDSVGVKTVGYGFNMEDPVTRSLLPEDVVAGKRALSQQEANSIYTQRMDMARNDAQNFVGPKTYSTLDTDRQSVLHDMAYNLGADRLGKFKQLKAALQKGDYDSAGDEMENSKWYKQVGQRARDLTDKMRAGTPQQILGAAVTDQLQ